MDTMYENKDKRIKCIECEHKCYEYLNNGTSDKAYYEWTRNLDQCEGIENSITRTTNHVEFVEYTGKYPNLCRGVLTLRIDGIKYRFGWGDGCDFEPFWSTGGSCGFLDNYIDASVTQGEWVIDEEDIPIQFRNYASEIYDVFNSNVDYGCCGGCL